MKNGVRIARCRVAGRTKRRNVDIDVKRACVIIVMRRDGKVPGESARRGLRDAHSLHSEAPDFTDSALFAVRLATTPPLPTPGREMSQRSVKLDDEGRRYAREKMVSRSRGKR